MIQSIKIRTEQACRYASSYLPSKRKMKTTAKVIAVAISVIIAIDYYVPDEYVESLCPEILYSTAIPMFIIRNTYDKGISFLWSEELFKTIASCSYKECHIYNEKHRYLRIALKVMMKSLWALPLALSEEIKPDQIINM